MAVDPATGLVVLDRAQKMPGRGAYVCAECLPGIKSCRRVMKAFRGRVCGVSEALAGRCGDPG